MTNSARRNTITGISLAVLATLIWSGNFIVARGIYKQIPPVNLAFWRWICASLILLPFAWNHIKKDWPVIKKSWLYFLIIAITGISIFNTFVYIGGQYTTAINLALIGTTTSPIMSVILARIFLKENIGWQKIVGMLICIVGILFLLSKGDFRNLVSFEFTKGDAWVLGAAFAFAIYNTMVKRKPSSISPISFLFVAFVLGTVILLPFYLQELTHTAPVRWDWQLVLIILYLGLGASVICFLIWNIAIRNLGAGRAALFGNLIPIFSSLEAVLILGEKFSKVHAVSMVLVFVGILLANLKFSR